MKRAIKVSLTADKSQGYGHLLFCCSKRQAVHNHEMEDGDVWHCVECNRPLMLKYDAEYWMIGENITI